jgi:hypothetical protein
MSDTLKQLAHDELCKEITTKIERELMRESQERSLDIRNPLWRDELREFVENKAEDKQ